jgi:ADP-ribose pyrophosphatase
MISDWPKIKSRRTTQISPWLSIIEREVEFAPERACETYYAVGQQDYIAIVAALPDGRIPIVRQYRPAVESFTWELPAGIVDPNEDAATCCRRELMEETGFLARDVHALGIYAPCTSRLSNRLHSFYVETSPTPERDRIEAGLELMLVNSRQLAKLIIDGEFTLQLHIGALLLAGMHGHIDLNAFRAARSAGLLHP